MKLIQSPSFARLLAFEQASWPVEEQATAEQLGGRLRDFPEGIFLLEVEGKDVAQFTVAPKNIPALNQIQKFAVMRDLPVDRSSSYLWGINLCTLPGETGKGYAKEIVTRVLGWAQTQGYASFTAGMTCPGLAQFVEEGSFCSVEEYMARQKNATVNTFHRAARSLRYAFEEQPPVKDYWPEDVGSLGYGVLVRITWPPITESLASC